MTLKVAVSSLCPFRKSAKRAQLQMRAIDSWREIFDLILLVGESEDQLCNSDQIKFIPSEDFPKTKTLVEVAAATPCEWAAIIDADIIIRPKLRQVLGMLKGIGATAATSDRLTYYENPEYPQKDEKDFGISFFVTEPLVWTEIAKLIPDQLRVGHPAWDGWLTGAITHVIGRSKFIDLSPLQLFLHPAHEDRHQPHLFGLSQVDERFAGLSGLPIRKMYST